MPLSATSSSSSVIARRPAASRKATRNGSRCTVAAAVPASFSSSCAASDSRLIADWANNACRQRRCVQRGTNRVTNRARLASGAPATRTGDVAENARRPVRSAAGSGNGTANAGDNHPALPQEATVGVGRSTTVASMPARRRNSAVDRPTTPPPTTTTCRGLACMATTGHLRIWSKWLLFKGFRAN